MYRAFLKSACLAATLVAAGCASTPTGSMSAVMPAPYKPFEVFQQDQYTCKNFASQQVAGQAENANGRAVAGALVGAALGAGLGAAVGDGRTTSIGAAYGAVAGTAIGASNASRDGYGIQRQYDIAYEQCMYAKGNQVPGYARMSPMPPPPPSRYR